MHERITKIRTDAGLSQSKFAEMLKVSRNFVFLIEKGERKPSIRVISEMCRLFGVNQEWLESGVGEPYKPLHQDETALYLSKLLTDTDDSVYKLIRGIMKTYCELSIKDQQVFKKFAKELLDNLKAK